MVLRIVLEKWCKRCRFIQGQGDKDKDTRRICNSTQDILTVRIVTVLSRCISPSEIVNMRKIIVYIKPATCSRFLSSFFLSFYWLVECGQKQLWERCSSCVPLLLSLGTERDAAHFYRAALESTLTFSMSPCCDNLTSHEKILSERAALAVNFSLLHPSMTLELTWQVHTSQRTANIFCTEPLSDERCRPRQNHLSFYLWGSWSGYVCSILKYMNYRCFFECMLKQSRPYVLLKRLPDKYQ